MDLARRYTAVEGAIARMGGVALTSESAASLLYPGRSSAWSLALPVLHALRGGEGVPGRGVVPAPRRLGPNGTPTYRFDGEVCEVVDTAPEAMGAPRWPVVRLFVHLRVGRPTLTVWPQDVLVLYRSVLARGLDALGSRYRFTNAADAALLLCRNFPEVHVAAVCAVDAALGPAAAFDAVDGFVGGVGDFLANALEAAPRPDVAPFGSSWSTR